MIGETIRNLPWQPRPETSDYYGAADTFVALAFAHLDELVAFAKGAWRPRS
jgi:predicted GH43/DUF377 family glycosyl hydrolase